MEQEQQKKKNLALPAEEQKQNTEINAEPAALDLEQLKSQVPKMFRPYVEPVMQWAQSVEDRLKVMEAELPQKTAEALQKLALQRQQEYLEKVKSGQAQNPVAGQGGLNLGGLAQALPYVLQMMGSGGGQDNQLQKLAMNALTSQINMSSAITNAVVAKITSKATSDVANDIV